VPRYEKPDAKYHTAAAAVMKPPIIKNQKKAELNFIA
jgi:hypothetical protein